MSSNSLSHGDDSLGRFPAISALALDPIEKKPLARFHPGKMILSVGFYGCSFSCPFCQNSSISQVQGKCGTSGSGTSNPAPAPANAGGASNNGTSAGDTSANQSNPNRDITLCPEELVAKALALQGHGNIGLAYTYSEPLIHIPYLLQTAKLAKAAGLKNVLVSNGFASKSTADEVLGVMDAANIDLKAFGQAGEGFYSWIGAKGGLDIVKRNIAFAAQLANLHLEITTLIIPGYNDSPDDMAAEAAWLASLRSDIPLHITRFHPAYQLLDVQPTPIKTIYQLVDIAKQHLKYVYAGNV